MPTNEADVEVLVRRVLEHVPRHVFVAIENEPEWSMEYEDLCDDARGGRDTVNRWIGKAVKKVLDADTIDEDVPVNDETVLIDTYTTLEV